MTKYKEEKLTEDKLYVYLGENIRRFRRDSHMTQNDLAEIIGCDQKQISRIELGIARPNLMICLRIANAFHVSIDSLLEGVVESETLQLLENNLSERILAQELLQVVKRYIR